jgi:4-alpha-glucanotransferase
MNGVTAPQARGTQPSWCLGAEGHQQFLSQAVSRITLQDVMRLDNEGRMNRPGRAEGNWAWRVGPPSVWKSLAKEASALKAMAEVFHKFGIAFGRHCMHYH